MKVKGMRRELLAVIGACMLAAPLAAPAQESSSSRPYSVVSLLGDKISLVGYVSGTGSHIDTNTLSELPLSDNELDRATLFAVEQAGVVPDVIVMAKGIASGFPISAVGAPRELMERWPVGSHGGTYGGNPIGCAAALATIEVLTEAGFLDGVVERGEQLRAGLRRIAVEHPVVADVRGPGLMVAVELRDPDTLASAPPVLDRPALLALAVFLDPLEGGAGSSVRLIDNRVLHPKS